MHTPSVTVGSSVNEGRGQRYRMDLREMGWGVGRGVYSPGSGYGRVAGSGECGDEPSGSDATALVRGQ
jgi:hypothetical protein